MPTGRSESSGRTVGHIECIDSAGSRANPPAIGPIRIDQSYALRHGSRNQSAADGFNATDKLTRCVFLFPRICVREFPATLLSDLISFQSDPRLSIVFGLSINNPIRRLQLMNYFLLLNKKTDTVPSPRQFGIMREIIKSVIHSPKTFPFSHRGVATSWCVKSSRRHTLLIPHDSVPSRENQTP